MRTQARIIDADRLHWYTSVGEPMFEVPKADGKGMTPTTLRHARKLNLLPSSTNILKVVPKPQLEAYKMEQVALALLTTPRKDGETDDDFVHRVLVEEEQQREESGAAAEYGSFGHDCVAHYFNEAVLPTDDRIRADLEAMTQWLAYQQIACLRVEQSLVGNGYAGTCDFIGIDNKEGRTVVIDWKWTSSVPKKTPWDAHQAQACSYAMALPNFDEQTRVVVGYFDRNAPGSFTPLELAQDDIFYGSRLFHAAMGLWIAMNDYDPRRPDHVCP
jgi:hypothetical protein